MATGKEQVVVGQHILSEAGHWVNQVEPWVEKRPHLLEVSTGLNVRASEWSDDRLGIVLDELADAENITPCYSSTRIYAK